MIYFVSLLKVWPQGAFVKHRNNKTFEQHGAEKFIDLREVMAGVRYQPLNCRASVDSGPRWAWCSGGRYKHWMPRRGSTSTSPDLGAKRSSSPEWGSGAPKTSRRSGIPSRISAPARMASSGMCLMIRDSMVERNLTVGMKFTFLILKIIPPYWIVMEIANNEIPEFTTV